MGAVAIGTRGWGGLEPVGDAFWEGVVVVESFVYWFESGVLCDLLGDVLIVFEVFPGLVGVDAPQLER